MAFAREAPVTRGAESWSQNECNIFEDIVRAPRREEGFTTSGEGSSFLYPDPKVVCEAALDIERLPLVVGTMNGEEADEENEEESILDVEGWRMESGAKYSTFPPF